MGRYSNYGIGLTYTCKMEASKLAVISELLDIPHIQIYSGDDIRYDIGKDVRRVMLDKKKVDTAINTPNVTNDMLYQCVPDGWDDLSYDDSDVNLIFYYEISSFESRSAESNDFYETNITPIKFMSEITSHMEEMKRCGIEQDDIKLHHFGSEWC